MSWVVVDAAVTAAAAAVAVAIAEHENVMGKRDGRGQRQGLALLKQRSGGQEASPSTPSAKRSRLARRVRAGMTKS